MEYTKSEAKLWAKKNMKGLEVPVFPSFTPDLEDLDEEGIRFDVNHIFASSGEYTVTVTAEDDDGGSSQDTIKVTVRTIVSFPLIMKP